MENPFEDIKDIKDRRLAFLQNTIEFYNLKNRGSNIHTCHYCPSETSPGCAIGRWMNRNNPFIHSGFSVYTEELFLSLPKWMQEMGNEFLGSIQGMHDDATFWTNLGLNERGVRRAEQIKVNYCL